MEAKKSDDEGGGLMYQQLRKFINVIVSFIIFLIFFRMNYAMWVFSNISSCQELQCWEDNRLVNLQCSSPSLVLISCPEVMV
jgi:hypothetical protein